MSDQSSTCAFTAWPHRTLWRCANQFPMSLVVAAYFPQPAVIWLPHEPKRQRTDHAVLQCRGPTSWNSLPQSFRDATLTLRQFQRRLKTSLLRLAYGRDLTALHSWLSRLLEWRITNVRTELNWTLGISNTEAQAMCYKTSVIWSWWFARCNRRRPYALFFTAKFFYVLFIFSRPTSDTTIRA